MSKKKATSEPVVAEEPARPEEQIRFDQSQVAPPSTRRTASERRSSSAAPKSYVARSASERRAARGTRTASTRAGHRHGEALSPQVVAELLEHPTIQVSEADLRRDYGYVIADLRSMALLSLGLIVTLAVLATVLPK